MGIIKAQFMEKAVTKIGIPQIYNIIQNRLLILLKKCIFKFFLQNKILTFLEVMKKY